MDNVIFGHQLRALRKKNKMSMNELSELIGISAKAISQIELGKKSTSLKVFVKLCNVFKTDPKYLLFQNLDDDLNEPENEQEELYKNILKLSAGDIRRYSDSIKLAIENKEDYK